MESIFDKIFDTARGVFKDITNFNLQKLQIDAVRSANAAQAKTVKAAAPPEAKTGNLNTILIAGSIVAAGGLAFFALRR